MDNPTNRYEATLIRRSVRKHTNGVRQCQGEEDEASGDVSLGLSLKVIAGKVIVKDVKPQLIDGSESPALKKIQRGDVVLSRNGTCLLPPSNITNAETKTAVVMEKLQALVTPNKETGLYEKTVHLELARGEGLALLERWEAVEEKEGNWVATLGEGYANLLDGTNTRAAPTPTNKNTSKRKGRAAVGGAAAVAGIAGLVLAGPFTAVAAAGGAAFVVAKKKGKNKNKNKEEHTISVPLA